MQAEFYIFKEEGDYRRDRLLKRGLKCKVKNQYMQVFEKESYSFLEHAFKLSTLADICLFVRFCLWLCFVLFCFQNGARDEFLCCIGNVKQIEMFRI